MLLRFLIYRRKSHFGTLTAAVFTAAKAPCILYICVMAKPVLINQSPFTAKELHTLFDYHDHNYGSCAPNWKSLRCGHSHSAATEATNAETSLVNSWREGADFIFISVSFVMFLLCKHVRLKCGFNKLIKMMMIAEGIVNVLQIDGRGHVIRRQSALQMISVVCWSRVGYQAFTQVSNHGQRRAWRACTQRFSCFHYGASDASAWRQWHELSDVREQWSRTCTLAAPLVNKKILHEKQIKFQLLRQSKTAFSF